jgi:uncharacterized protein YcaQ
VTRGRPAPTDFLSARQAASIALQAQGLADPAPSGRVDARHRRRVLDRVGLLQIDSVNVLARAHYLPMFTRLGPYPCSLLDAAAYGPHRELFEYWGHEASLLPVELQPALRWRMARARDDAWGQMREVAQRHPGLLAQVRELIESDGPLTAGEIESRHEGPRRAGKGPWWDWSLAKSAVEFLFWSGDVTTAQRRGFERVYDLTERVLPPRIVNAPTPSVDEAIDILVERSARSLGVATARDLRDYFRLPAEVVPPALERLVERGAVTPVAVEGWRGVAYRHCDARPARPAALRPRLVGPFDPLIWDRSRTERVFGLRYRLEIYVPAHARVHGYYVLPLLIGDRFVARLDLKADRSAGVLRVQATHREPAVGERSARASDDAMAALAVELRSMATWLDLAHIEVANRGDGARALRASLRR